MRKTLPLCKILASNISSRVSGLDKKPLQGLPYILSSSRDFANLPTDYGRYYDNLEAPRRRVPSESQQAEAQAPEESNSGVQDNALKTSAEGDSNAKLQQQSAASVTAWMFPWEKRQMDGQSGPLRSWEKMYWWIFVSAIAFFLYTRLSGKDTVEAADPEEAERKEKRKLKAARLLMAGQPLSEEDEEQFEGLTPREIQDYVDKSFGKSRSSDPFEGMSPEEINEMLASAPSTQ